MKKNIFFALSLFLAANVFAANKELTIYSVYSQEQLASIFAPFTKETGINVKIINGKSKDMINRIAQEGVNTQADLHLDKDLTYHAYAVEKGIYQPFNSTVVESNVPANFIESNKNWLTIFYRSRVIMYNKETVRPSELSTYEDLGSQKWRGKLCVRTSSNSYNTALGAYMVAHKGPKKAFQIFKNWVANFSVAPLKKDREVIHAIAEGRCDVGLVNSYYLVPMLEENPDFPVRPFFAKKAHVNGVGIGITKYSKNVKEATMLLEYLTSLKVQAPAAAAFDQYPVNKKAKLSPMLKSFGKFEADTTNVGMIGNFTELADKLMKEADYK